MNTESNNSNFNRRDFIRGGSVATLMTLLGGVELTSQVAKGQAAETKPEATGPKTKCAVIGFGTWGREIVATLSRLPSAEVAVVCDTYQPSLKRAGTAAPGAKLEKDYRKVLENPDVQAVLVATPSHQ